MKYEFSENEFTSWDILEFLTKVYGTQISGSPFTSVNIQNWIRYGKLPDLYGGYKIIKTERYNELQNLLIITIEGLCRDQLIDITGSLSEYAETSNKKRIIDVIPKVKRPRKNRTEFYFKTLEKVGKQYTKRSLSKSLLPIDWKDAGIKGNQLVLKKKRSNNA